MKACTGCSGRHDGKLISIGGYCHVLFLSSREAVVTGKLHAMVASIHVHWLPLLDEEHGVAISSFS